MHSRGIQRRRSGFGRIYRESPNRLVSRQLRALAQKPHLPLASLLRTLGCSIGYRSIWSAGSGPRFHSFPLRFDVQDHEYRPGTPILLAGARALQAKKLHPPRPKRGRWPARGRQLVGRYRPQLVLGLWPQVFDYAAEDEAIQRFGGWPKTPTAAVEFTGRPRNHAPTCAGVAKAHSSHQTPKYQRLGPHPELATGRSLPPSAPRPAPRSLAPYRGRIQRRG